MNPLVASVIRTLIPVIVGQVASWLLLANITIPATALDGLGTFLGGILTAVYYVGVRVLEQQWPKAGILLGLTASPDTYSKGDPEVPSRDTPSVSQPAPAIETAPATVFPTAKVEAATAPVIEPVAVVPVFEAPAVVVEPAPASVPPVA